MTHKHLVAIIGLAAALSLSGCTSFTPVYGDVSSTGISAARFNFAPPETRSAQLIMSRLDIVFPGPAGPGDPILSVVATEQGLSRGLVELDGPEPRGVRVEATVTITKNDQVVFTATRFADTAYQGGELTPTTIFSATGARETAARAVAEALRVAILAGYRPPIVASVPGN
jgi:hypothetical protein